MKKGIFISIIVLLLAVVCFIEQNLIDSTLKSLHEKTNEVYLLSSGQENVNSFDIINKTRALKEFWEDKELLLCIFINHKDIQEIGFEITKMLSYSQENITEEYITSLNLVIHLLNKFDHIMGISFQNLV